jgi:hypothetical protein
MEQRYRGQQNEAKSTKKRKKILIQKVLKNKVVKIISISEREILAPQTIIMCSSVLLPNNSNNQIYQYFLKVKSMVSLKYKNS